MSSVHALSLFGEVGHFTERSGFLELCVICEKLMVYRVALMFMKLCLSSGPHPSAGQEPDFQQSQTDQ